MQHGGFGSTSGWIPSQIFGPGGRSRSAFLRTWTPQGRSESASSSPTAGPGESQRGGAFSNQRTSAAARACGEYIARSAALLKTRGAQMMLPVSSHATGALAVEMCRRCGHPEPLDPDAGHRSARPPMQGEHPAPACDLIQPASPVTPRFEVPELLSRSRLRTRACGAGYRFPAGFGDDRWQFVATGGRVHDVVDGEACGPRD